MRDILSSVHIKVLPYRFPEEQETLQRHYLICGEQRVFTVVIELPEAENAEHMYRNLYGRLEGYTVSEGSLGIRDSGEREKSGSHLLHRMRSVESLTSTGSNDGRGALSLANERPRQWAAQLHNEHTITIHIPILVDSDQELAAGASVLLKLALLETFQDASMARFFAGRRSGVRLLRKLLTEKEEQAKSTGLVLSHKVSSLDLDPVHRALASSLEIIKEIETKLPLYRPLQALLTVHKITPEATLIGVVLKYLTAGGDVSIGEECTLLDMQVAIGEDSDPHSTTLFRTRPYALHHLPSYLSLGGSFGAIFETTIIPFTERCTLRGLRTDKVKVVLLARVQMRNEFVVRFESELDLSRMFPAEVSDQLTISLAGTLLSPGQVINVDIIACDPEHIFLNEAFDIRVFVHNGSNADHDLLLQVPLDGSAKGEIMSYSKSLTIHNHYRDPKETLSQEQVAQSYVAHDMAAPAFIPLSAEMSIGYRRFQGCIVSNPFKSYRLVPAGACADGILRILPIREGPHWIKKIMVIDRHTGHRFDLLRVLQIHVQERRVPP